jgi:hypothetical protein
MLGWMYMYSHQIECLYSHLSGASVIGFYLAALLLLFLAITGHGREKLLRSHLFQGETGNGRRTGRCCFLCV